VEHRAELHENVEAWTRTLPPEEVMRRLQERGVAAGLVAEADDLCRRDPQLRARAYWQHVAGETFDGVPITMSASAARIESAAPSVGQQTNSILERVLGLSHAEVAALQARRVVA
jgi:benzylsuccinate CoA-transferase BbsF subunit